MKMPRKSTDGTISAKQWINDQRPIIDVEYYNKVILGSSHKISSVSKDNLNVTGAVGHNHSSHFQQSPATVVPCAALKMLEKATKSAEQRVNIATTSGEIFENNQIDDFTQKVSSSTDEMPLSARMSLTSVKERFSQKKLSTSKSPVEQTNKSRLHKRSSTSMPNQEETPKKRAKKSKSSPTKIFIEKHDMNDLLHEISKQVNLEQILQAYKVSRTKEEVEREASRVLSPKSKSNFSSPAKALCLQNTLLQLSKMYDSDDFAEVVLKTISDQLDASKVLDILKVDDLKGPLLEKLTVTELLDLSRKRNSSFVREEVLRTASANEIINHVSTRNDWNASEPLLKIMLESFSQIVLGELNPDLEKTVFALISATANVVKSKNYIKSSEQLLNIMLQNGLEVLTDETKKIMKNVILQKFSRSDIAHLVNEILLPREVIHID